MKKRLAVIFGALLVLAFAAGTAFSMSYEDIFKKSGEYFNGKIDRETFIALCTSVADDAGNDSKTRAYALAARGRAFLDAGDIKKGISDAEVSISTDGTIPGGYQTMAIAYVKDGKFTEAADFFQKSADISSSEEYKKQSMQSANFFRVLGSASPAATLHKEISDNPFAAEEKYAGKMVGIRGPASKIGRTMSGLPQITMEVEPFKEIECELSKEAAPALAKLKKGDDVLLVCNLKKAGNSIITFGGCYLWGK